MRGLKIISPYLLGWEEWGWGDIEGNFSLNNSPRLELNEPIWVCLNILLNPGLQIKQYIFKKADINNMLRFASRRYHLPGPEYLVSMRKHIEERKILVNKLVRAVPSSALAEDSFVRKN